ncbi:MAG: hypothetical protein WC307_01055 [Candidatus Nanoarchaeia archaeon]|jgi:hypothetical protein
MIFIEKRSTSLALFLAGLAFVVACFWLWDSVPTTYSLRFMRNDLTRHLTLGLIATFFGAGSLLGLLKLIKPSSYELLPSGIRFSGLTSNFFVHKDNIESFSIMGFQMTSQSNKQTSGYSVNVHVKRVMPDYYKGIAKLLGFLRDKSPITSSHDLPISAMLLKDKSLASVLKKTYPNIPFKGSTLTRVTYKNK